MSDRLRHLVRILTASSLPIRARLELLWIMVRWRTRPLARYAIHLPSGPVFLENTSIRFDLKAFVEIFVYQPYGKNLRGRVVLDLGAHRGYFGAFAISRGAARVLSVEPEADNFRSLEDARAQVQDAWWETIRAAVGSSSEAIALNVTDRSWSHSIVKRLDAPVLEVQKVPQLTVPSLLERLSPDKVFVKMDIEGAECEAILGATSGELSPVDELVVEFHDFSPCAVDKLIAHLDAAGLGLVGRTSDVYRLARNSPRG